MIDIHGLDDSSDVLPLTQAQKAELDRRIEEMDRDGGGGVPLDLVLDNLGRGAG
jgi:putative addiction module component (TIGR02574 family)